MELPQERRTAHSDITSFLILSNNHFAWRLKSRRKNVQFKVVSISKVDPSDEIRDSMWTAFKESPAHRDVEFMMLAEVLISMELPMVSKVRPLQGKYLDQNALNSSTHFATFRANSNKIYSDNTEVIFGEEQIIADDGTRKFLYTLEVSQPTFPRVPMLQARETLAGALADPVRTFAKCFDIVKNGILELPSFKSEYSQDQSTTKLGIEGIKKTRNPAIRFLDCTPMFVAEASPSGTSIWASQGHTGSEILHLAISQVMNRLLFSNVNLTTIHSKLMSIPGNQQRDRREHDRQVLQDLHSLTKPRLDSSLFAYILSNLRTGLRDLLDKAALQQADYLSGAHSPPNKTISQLTTDKVALRTFAHAPFFKLLLDVTKVRIWVDLMRGHLGSEFEAEMYKLSRKTKVSQLRVLNACYQFLLFEKILPDFDTLRTLSGLLAKNSLTSEFKEAKEYVLDSVMRLNLVKLTSQDEEKVFCRISRAYWRRCWFPGAIKDQKAALIPELLNIWVKTAVYGGNSSLASVLGLPAEFDNSLLRFLAQVSISNAGIPQSMALLRSAIACKLGLPNLGISTFSVLVNPWRRSTSRQSQPRMMKIHNFIIPLGRYSLLCETSGTDHTLVDTVTGRTVPVKTSHSLTNTNNLNDRFLCNLGPGSSTKMVCRQSGISPRFFFIRQPSTAEAAALFASNTGVASSIDSWLEIPPAGNPLETFSNNTIWIADFWGESLMLYYQHAMTHRVSFLRVRDSRNITLVDTFDLKELWVGKTQQFDRLMRDILATRRSQFSHIAMIHNSRYILQVSPCYGQYSEFYSKVHLVAVKRYSSREVPPAAVEIDIGELNTPANLVTNSVKLLHLASHKASLCALSLTQSTSPSNNLFGLRVILLQEASGKLVTVGSTSLLDLGKKKKTSIGVIASRIDIVFEPPVYSHNKAYLRLSWSSPGSPSEPSEQSPRSPTLSQAPQLHFARLRIEF